MMIFVCIIHFVTNIIHFLHLIVNVVILVTWFFTVEYPFFVLNVEDMEASPTWIGNEIFRVLLSFTILGDFAFKNVVWNRLNFELLLIVEFVT